MATPVSKNSSSPTATRRESVLQKASRALGEMLTPQLANAPRKNKAGLSSILTYVTPTPHGQACVVVPDLGSTLVTSPTGQLTFKVRKGDSKELVGDYDIKPSGYIPAGRQARNGNGTWGKVSRAPIRLGGNEPKVGAALQFMGGRETPITVMPENPSKRLLGGLLFKPNPSDGEKPKSDTLDYGSVADLSTPSIPKTMQVTPGGTYRIFAGGTGWEEGPGFTVCWPRQ